MSRLYLTDLALTEFRSFAGLRVELPAEPGVMIVHGTNGLGKSSLFDGLEWALTGTIEHFRDAAKGVTDKDYLRRWHAPNASPTQITLGFSDGVRVSRLLGSGQPKLDGFNSVTEYLRAPLWKQEIGDLQRYLLLTHFLGQSTLSRMTHRKPEERWQFLQEPAQSDWANRIATTLHGHGSSIPAKTYDRKSKELTRQVSELEHLMGLEEQQWRDSLTEGALDETNGLLEAEALFNQLAALAPLVGGSRPAQQALAADAMAEAAQTFANHLADLARTRESGLARSRVLLSEQQRVEESIAANAAALAAAQTQTVSVEQEVSARAQDVASRRAVLIELENQIEARAAQTRQFIAVRGLRTQVEATNAALADARALAARLGNDVDLATVKVMKEDRRRAIVARLSVEIGDIGNLAEQETVRLRRLNELERAEQLRADALNSLDAAKAVNVGLEESLTSAEREAQDSIATADALAAEFTTLRQAVDALSAAVSSVAANLPPNQCDCPVCATPFGTVEELRTRAALAADRLAPALTSHAKRMTDAQAARDRRVMMLALLREAQADMSAREQALASAAAKRDEISREFFGPEPFSERALLQMRLRTEGAIATYTRRRARKEHWQQHRVLGGSAGSLASWSLAIQHRNEIEIERGVQTRRFDELSQTILGLRERLAVAESTVFDGSPTSDDALNTRIGTAQALEEEAKSRVAAASEELHRASEIHDRAARTAAERIARRDELQRAAEQLKNELATIRDEWRSLQIAVDQLTIDEILRAERLLAEAASQKSVVEQRLQRLREARVVWNRQVSHHETIERLREIAGAAPNVSRDALRSQILTIQSAWAQKTTAIMQAKSIAQKSYGEVTKAVEAFNREYLKPLNKLMNKLNRAILSEPDIGLDLRVGKKKVEQTAIKSPDAPAHVTKLDPQLVHSEGQMAALAVSMLCAASLTFPWSRWSCLILDDPLQHNDVIHTAAFADMLCNLIRAKGYQVFLSTHDLAQAEFLRRKFSAASVPCTTVHLLGRGLTGIDASIKYQGGRQDPTVTPGESSQAG